MKSAITVIAVSSVFLFWSLLFINKKKIPVNMKKIIFLLISSIIISSIIMASCGGEDSAKSESLLADQSSPDQHGEETGQAPEDENDQPAGGTLQPTPDPVADEPGSQGSSRSDTLRWEAPITNTDGTPLADLAGFKIYTQTPTEILIEDAGNMTTHTFSGISSGETRTYKVTAYNTAGIESGFSNEAVRN